MLPVTVADSLSTQKPDREKLGLEHTREFVDRVFGPDLHALRVLSLANGVAGVLNAAVLSIHAIGQAYANVAKIAAKSGVKQVDRMLGNDALSLDIVLARWVRFVVGENASILIALDWTDFDKDDHTTLCAYMVTTHGRAMPLAWKTVKKSALKDQRTGHELEMVERLHTWLPENVNITLLADRAFGYQELYALLEAFGWDFVIRFRGCILVESAEGAVRPAEDWVPSNGRPKLLVGARVTDKRAAVGAVVLVKAARMKEAWCLATSLATTKAAEVVKLYGRRLTIEETFRDTKDLHFGMGLSATNIRDAARRDRLLLLVAMAHTLLTLLGAASEASGLDRTLKVNTVKKRTHSLYRQGLYWYHCIPTMREEWLRRLVDAFDRIVREHASFSHFFEVK
ncbi:IS4 family transposase [Sorangium sp. So ce1036]|uniref:IS4 family transposase n=1 Tax=Sorangium sp. So ce1036 TaxID=3133328 RepID=UPI003F51E8F9